MSRAKKSDDENHNQFHRFQEAARELGCDEDEAHFDEKLGKIARQRAPARKDEMSIQTENYKGWELFLRIMGPPPYYAMVRRPGASLYESETPEGDSENSLRAAAQALVDRLIAQG